MATSIKAQLGEQVRNAMQPENKETVQIYNLIGCKRNKMQQLVTVRCYMGRSRSASNVHACIWIHSRDKDYYASGKGTASGFGYDKESEAIAIAIKSADISLSEPIGGRGETAVRNALEGIAHALGYKNILITSN